MTQLSAPAQHRRVALAAMAGTTIEWFDFFIYALCTGLVFNSRYFAGLGDYALIASFATIGISFVFRPLGAVLAGHLGDRIGRRNTLIMTLLLMGAATTLIGLVPPASAIGASAPLLLVLLRILQGVSSGGEWAGAALLAVEHAPAGRRGLFGSYPQLGVPLGLLAANGAFAAVTAGTSSEQFLSWGWRIPFLAVLPLSLVGLWLRNRVDETPEFLRETDGGREIVKAPVREALRDQWRPMLVFCGASIMLAILSYTWVTYYPEYLTSSLGLSRTEALASNLISVAALMPLLPLAGRISDRIGRRPMLITGALACLGLVPVAFAIGEIGTFGAAVASQLVYIVPEFFLTGIVTTCSAELFATRTRFSASAIAYNCSFSLFMGFTPFLAALLVDQFGSIYAVWAYLAVFAVLALVVITAFMQETYRSELAADKYA